MNRFLRTAPTRQLISVLVGICAVIALGATLAVAASSGGPVPVAKPLAQAIHDALGAPPVDGVAADVSFTNNLIDASELQGSDPLLTGGTGRLWLSSDHRFRLELQTDGGSEDAQIVVDNGSFWAYDPTSNTVYKGMIPATSAHKPASKPRAARNAVPTVAKIQQELGRVMTHADVSGAIPSDVAGQPTYTVRVSPKESGGLIGAAELAWDAVRGVPLRFALYARGDTTPVLELSATDISYGPQPASVFSISPPVGAKVVDVNTQPTSQPRFKRAHKHRQHASGLAAMAKHLPFALDAPASLGGLARQSVSLLGSPKHPAALIVYGRGLGSVVVLEQQASRSAPADPSQSSDGGDGPGLNLPTVSVNGTTAQELDTALGTVVRFTRAGVSYTVAGSVTPMVADAAARGL